MAFETKKVYRPINGGEIKTIIAKRVEAAMMEDATLNLGRAFPLLKYEITIKLIPYNAAGQDREGKPQFNPGSPIAYEVDGATYLPVEEQAVELVENSPLYGVEADPQDLRKLAEQGTIETTRTNTGELVDVRTKPGKDVPQVDPPPQVITQPQSWPDKQAPAEHLDPNERPEDTEAAERQRWATKKDLTVEKAIETRDPSLAPGRVSVITSAIDGGGSDHGRGKKR